MVGAHEKNKKLYIHNVHTHPPFCKGGEVEPLTKFSKWGGGWLDKNSTFRGSCWERGGMNFFQGG